MYIYISIQIYTYIIYIYRYIFVHIYLVDRPMVEASEAPPAAQHASWSRPAARDSARETRRNG